MQVQKTQFDSGADVRNTAKAVAASGLAVAGADRLFLSADKKAAVKIKRMGEDKFVKKSAEAAQKAADKLGASKINVNQTAENAKKLYPEFVDTAKKANKRFGKMFAAGAAVAAGIGAGIKFLSAKSADKKQESLDTDSVSEKQAEASEESTVREKSESVEAAADEAAGFSTESKVSEVPVFEDYLSL